MTESEFIKAESFFSSLDNGWKCIPSPEEESVLAERIVSLKAKHAIVGTKKYVGPLYKALPKGGVIARFGVAHDGIDKVKVKDAHLFCTNTPNVLTDSVAELTIGLMLTLARRMVGMTESIKNGNWQPFEGVELKNKTLAVIGCGAIGCRIAQIASFGFHMKVIGYDVRELDIERMKREHGYNSIVGEFFDAVHQADFISLHIPLMDSTQNFINSKRLKMMPTRSYLINTSRGAVVDEKALFSALKSEIIAGAALDVFSIEPYHSIDQAYDLRLLNNVVFTPHIGSSTVEANRLMALGCLKNIELAENGEFDKMDLITSP